MRKRKLSLDFNATKARDSEAEITGTDFAKAISKLAEDKLAGALTVETVGESDGFINVSPTLCAHVIMAVLSLAEPDDLMHMTVTLSNTMRMEIHHRRTIDTEDLAKIISFAATCGLAVERFEGGVAFSTEIRHSELLKIYAGSASDFVKNLENIFDL